MDPKHSPVPGQVHCLGQAGVTEDTRRDVFRVVAALLHLGQLAFGRSGEVAVIRVGFERGTYSCRGCTSAIMLLATSVACSCRGTAATAPHIAQWHSEQLQPAATRACKVPKVQKVQKKVQKEQSPLACSCRALLEPTAAACSPAVFGRLAVAAVLLTHARHVTACRRPRLPLWLTAVL